MSAGPDLKSLIAYGYFPKELPSPFRTVSLARVLESLPTDLGNDPDQPTRFNLARAGGFRRPLAIPNPRSQISVARSWQTTGRSFQHITRRARCRLRGRFPRPRQGPANVRFIHATTSTSDRRSVLIA